MATQPWKYLINTFYAQTVDTIKNALSLTVDHLAKLTANEADADILSIKTNFAPIHTAFVTVYNQLESKKGIYKGKTQSFEELMEELAETKINEWRGQVFAIFPEGSPDATAIFPRDRKPFYEGTYEQQIEAVEALSLTLATNIAKPTLITLGLAVEAHHTVLLGARALQQTDEGSTATLRTNLKNAHVLLCNALYRNLGLLMAKYAATPLTVANYYDLTLLRNTGDEPIVINGTAGPNSVVNLNGLIDAEVEDITPSTTIIMRNKSTEPVTISFYFSMVPAAPPGASTQYILAPGEELEKTYEEIAVPGMEFFNVQNASSSQAIWEIEIIL